MPQVATCMSMQEHLIERSKQRIQEQRLCHKWPLVCLCKSTWLRGPSREYRSRDYATSGHLYVYARALDREVQAENTGAETMPQVATCMSMQEHLVERSNQRIQEQRLCHKRAHVCLCKSTW